MGMHEPTRRGALAALAGSAAFAGSMGVAMLAGEPALAAEADSAEADAAYDRGYEDGCADGMLAFAHAWLTKFTSHGGSVTRDHADPNKVWIGQPMHRWSPDYEQERALLDTIREQDWFKGMSEQSQAAHIERHRRCADDMYMGQMRALGDLLHDFPEGLEAVKRLVRGNSALGLPPHGEEV